MKKIYPHIIGIGSAYAGLGLVSELLGAHPAISNSLPPRNFFNTDIFTKRGRGWYEEQLVADASGLLVGDCTAGYLVHPDAADRIASLYPDAKLFVVVRHPVKRLLVEFQALQKIDKTAAHSSAAVYLADHTDLQSRSSYGYLLERFFGYYSPLQLHIIVYEDLVADPLSVMADLYEFYGVDKNFIPARLNSYVPPPEEPKHRSLLSKLFKYIKLAYKKATYRTPVPVFPPEVDVSAYLSPEEEVLFNRVYTSDARVLSNFLGRDMNVFWNLSDDTMDTSNEDLALK